MPLFAEGAFIGKPGNNLSILGHWSFEDGSGTRVSDVSGNGRHATLVNTDSTNWVTSRSGKAVAFDGSAEYASIGDINVGTQYTVSAWIYPTTLPSSGDSYIHNIFCDEGPSNNSTFCFRMGSHGTLANRQKCAVAAYTTVGANDMESASDLPANTWTHCTATVDNSGATKTVRFYINGVFDRSETYTGTVNNGSAGFRIGFSPDSNTRYFEGRLDEIKLYNRLLTDGQVLELYRSGARPLAAPNNRGLVAYWHLNDGSTTSAGDGSGNGFTGTLTNGPLWRVGRAGKGIFLDGVDDYVRSTSIIPVLQTNTQGTMSFWMKKDVGVSTGKMLGWGTNGDSSTIGWIGITAASTGQILFRSSSSDLYRGTFTYPDDGKWHMITLTANGSGNVVYVDGSAVTVTYTAGSSASTNWFDDLSGTPEHFTIGSDGRLAAFFPGYIDEVRMYNRALTSTEVRALHASAPGPTLNASSATLQGEGLAQGLLGFWTFDGPDTGATIADRSGQANHGYVIGAATSSLKVIGKLGQALLFSGSSSYITASPNTLTSSFSVSMWMNLGSGLFQNRAIGNGRGASTGWGVGLGDQDGEFRFTKYGVVDADKDIGSWPSGWTHVGWVVGSDNDVTLYINGVSQGTYGNTQSIVANGTGTFVIGADVSGVGIVGSFWNGALDDVRIYDRSLSAAEMVSLYRLGR